MNIGRDCRPLCETGPYVGELARLPFGLGVTRGETQR